MMELEIRLLRDSDLPAAIRLKELAQWNQTENDWRRLIQLDPNGCFCATRSGEVVATATTTTYGANLAWIGMVLVDPQHRRCGIATKLVEVALAYARRAGSATIKLDATAAGRPVYENLGFKEESLIERWQGIAATQSQARSTLNSAARNELLEFDSDAFGEDRANLIDLLIEDSFVEPRFKRNVAGRLTGYAIARRGTVATYLGPVLADSSATAESLVDEMLHQLLGERVYLDINTNFELGRQILMDRGFVKQRDFIRMAYGKDNKAGTSRSIFAIAGPEIG
jgi:GNAT superfamily N-acetyltransferase